MPLGDYGLGGREARGAYESAKASVGSNNSEKDGSSLAPDTSSRPRSRPDNVAPVRSDDNKSSAPATSVRPRARPDNVTPVKADSISITNEDTKKVEAYIDYLTGNIVYKDNSRLSKSIKDNVAKNLSSLYPDFSNKTINSLVEKHGPSLIGGLTSEAISMLSPEDRETLAAMQPLGRGINTTPESLREAFNISPGWKAMSTDINSIIGYLENPEQALETIVDRTSGTLDFGIIHPSFRGLTGKIQGDKTISIGGKKTFAEGGKVSDEAQLEMELIMNEQVDPVSGNTAPIGAKPEEVRDDIEIRVSPGEYVINAQTVRYFGEDFFDELQKTAEEGFERIKEGEELPFRDDELDIEDDETEEVEPEGFAYGGRVKGYAEGDLVVPEPVGGGYGQYGGTGAMFMGYQSKTFINDETGQKIIIFFFNGRPLSRIPAGFREMGETPAEEQEQAAVETAEAKGPAPQLKEQKNWENTPVEEWTDNDFREQLGDYQSKIRKGQNPLDISTTEKIFLSTIGNVIAPGAGIALANIAKKQKEKKALEILKGATSDIVAAGFYSNTEEAPTVIRATDGSLINRETGQKLSDEETRKIEAAGLAAESTYIALGINNALDEKSKESKSILESAKSILGVGSSKAYQDTVKDLYESALTTYDPDNPLAVLDPFDDPFGIAVEGYEDLLGKSNRIERLGPASETVKQEVEKEAPKSALAFDPETSVFQTQYDRDQALGGEGSSRDQYLASQEIHSQGLQKKRAEQIAAGVDPEDAVKDNSYFGKKEDGGQDGGQSSNDKVLCDLIHRYGYLDEDIWRLDEAFGDRLAIEDPELMEGYHTWAKPMVAWIERESFLAKLYLKYWCVPFTRRWANHIAHIMEPENYKPDYVGKLMLAIGVPISRAIYKLKGRKLKTV